VRRSLALALALVLAAVPAQAAVEHVRDTQHSGYETTSETFTATIDPGDDRYLLAAVVLENGAVVTGASLGGQPMGRIAATSSAANHCRAEWWGFAAPPVGDQVVSFQFSGPGGHLDTTLLAYQDVAGLGSFAASTGSGLDGPGSVTVTSAAGEVVLDVICGWSTASQVAIAGNDQNAHWHWSSGMMSSAISEHAGAPSVTMSWTDSGPDPLEWASAGVALRVAGQRASVGLNVQTTGCAMSGRPGGVLPILGAVLWGYARRRRSGNMRRPVP
jgi:hypothetical protein